MELRKNWLDLPWSSWKIRRNVDHVGWNLTFCYWSLKEGYLLSVKCRSLCINLCSVTIIYGPTNYREKKVIWPVGFSAEAWCLGGDFSMTKSGGEHFPKGRMSNGMRKFNNFIEEPKLIQVPLLNGKFTWSKEGRVVLRSLLDRFFIFLAGSRLLQTHE